LKITFILFAKSLLLLISFFILEELLALYTGTRAGLVVGGFKVFYKQDKPRMTPKQVLGLEKVSNKRVRDMPKIITYQ